MEIGQRQPMPESHEFSIRIQSESNGKLCPCQNRIYFQLNFNWKVKGIGQPMPELHDFLIRIQLESQETLSGSAQIRIS